jgi:hypothetical protein
MRRILLLALFCFAALGCPSAIRLAVERGQAVSIPSLASDVVDVDKASPKADRLLLRKDIPTRLNLDLNDFAKIDPRYQAGVLALKKAAAAAPALKPDSTADPKPFDVTDDVISWHWREGAKIVRKRQSP